ncbi:putative inositol-polyphosphate 5-phosphatase [Helianthus anomalus]
MKTVLIFSFKAILQFEFQIFRRILWLGDLNYRLSLSYEETCDLISKNAWPKLLESDQVIKLL